ncbi:MAG: hypothetical protein MUF28_01890 [Ignavibacterium sp.]|nr:hypothetical protein [Ignavibacterium sp.]
MAAINTSCAVALGTFALSVLANINVMVDSSSNNNSMLLALLIWPIITGSLSFLVAFIISKIIISIRSKS